MKTKISALICAAGIGSRLSRYTESIPKCLLCVGGRPLLDYWISALNSARISDTLITTSRHSSIFEKYIERHNRSGVLPKLHQIIEPELLGSAGSIRQHRDYLTDDNLIVIYGDNLSTVNLKELMAYHKSHSLPITLLTFITNSPEKSGILSISPTGVVTSFEEKPLIPKSNLANAGLYVLRKEAIDYICNTHAEDFGLDVLPKFIGRMQTYSPDILHVDVGTEANLRLAQENASKTTLNVPPTNRAVFFDRDGTLIKNIRGLKDLAQIEILPGAKESVQKVRSAGYLCIVITNQAAVFDGWLTCKDVENVNKEVNRQLGGTIDAFYYAPQSNKSGHLDRKPGPGMLWKAAIDFGLDLKHCWVVGDSESDISAGINAGCVKSIKLGADCSISRAASIIS